MFVQTEITPNPNSLKFLPGRAVSNQGSYEIKKKEETNNELVRNLLSVNGVEGIFLGNEFITINKNLDENQKEQAVRHEKLHVLQMRQGKTWYDSKNVYHKPTKGSPILKYKRIGNKMLVGGKPMHVGDPKNPIEKEVYAQTGEYPTPIKKK